jgi:hypothetical protein
MLTIFTIPKPFRGYIGIIQTNAIQSWLQLRPPCEIILFGDEEGTAEVASELGVQHIPEIECNEYGTPLISDAFRVAQELASHPLLCYVNADIILMSDFLAAVRRIRFRRFLMVGQRWDMDLKEPWNFDQRDWEELLRRNVAQRGALHPPIGSDYFVFPREAIGQLPPFAVGRPRWDNWLIYRARALGIPVIDATRVVTPVHQSHDYSHVPFGTGKTYEGLEANRNQDLVGSEDYLFNLHDANWILTSQGLTRPMITMRRLRRYLETLPVLSPRIAPYAPYLKLMSKLLDPYGMIWAIRQKLHKFL